MKNVKIELVKTVGKLDYFLVTSEKAFIQKMRKKLKRKRLNTLKS
jgi:hypothetical protein